MIPRLLVAITDPAERGFRLGIDTLGGLVPLRPAASGDFRLGSSRLGDARLAPIPARRIDLDLAPYATAIRTRHGNSDGLVLQPDPGSLDAVLKDCPDLTMLGITPGTPLRLEHEGQQLWEGTVTDIADTWRRDGTRISHLTATDEVATWGRITRHGASDRLGPGSTEPLPERIKRLLSSAPGKPSQIIPSTAARCANTLMETSLTAHLTMAATTGRMHWTLHRGEVRLLDAFAQTQPLRTYTDDPARQLAPPITEWTGAAGKIEGDTVLVPAGSYQWLNGPWCQLDDPTRPVLLEVVTRGLTPGVTTYLAIKYLFADGTESTNTYLLSQRVLPTWPLRLRLAHTPPSGATAVRAFLPANHPTGSGGGQQVYHVEITQGPADSYYEIERAAGSRSVVSAVDLTTHLIGGDGNADDTTHTITDPTSAAAYGIRSASADVTAPLPAMAEIGQWLLTPAVATDPTITRIMIAGTDAYRPDGTPLRPLDPITVHRLGRAHLCVISAIEHTFEPRIPGLKHRVTLHLRRTRNG